MLLRYFKKKGNKLGIAKYNGKRKFKPPKPF
jgi:hypothetical protein